MEIDGFPNEAQQYSHVIKAKDGSLNHGQQLIWSECHPGSEGKVPVPTFQNDIGIVHLSS